MKKYFPYDVLMYIDINTLKREKEIFETIANNLKIAIFYNFLMWNFLF